MTAKTFHFRIWKLFKYITSWYLIQIEINPLSMEEKKKKKLEGKEVGGPTIDERM